MVRGALQRLKPECTIAYLMEERLLREVATKPPLPYKNLTREIL
jgi:hypothetical protein